MPWNLTQPAVVVVCGIAACQEQAKVDQVSLYLDDSAERRLRVRDVVMEPADNVLSARVDAQGRIVIQRANQQRALRISAPNLCPVSVAPGPQRDAQALQPVLTLGGDRTGIGFGTRFSVQARHNCPERGRGAIQWRQLEGPALAELQVRDAGFGLSARTASFADLHPEPAPEGIVPISPRTQGRVVLQASWQGPGLPELTRTMIISAAARSTGLSSVAVSQPLVLSGPGWNVQTRPPGAHASVKVLEGLSFFTADAPGSWTLAKAEGQTLKLQSLTHDATPYDCGRAECHAALSEQTAESAMSHALERPLATVTGAAAASCMLDCHVLGERGLSDGGFLALSARLGFTWTEHTRWQDLPQALRRAGGVRCTACHGPGAIPPPEQRSAILASDVCATCHDAPPRYVHVAQWRSSRMATSDRAEATRRAPCARCHTTAGFLAHNGDRKLSDEPQRAEPTGIACAACHAPHSPNRGPRLIRDVEAPAGSAGELFAEPSTTLCRACHASAPSTASVARGSKSKITRAQEDSPSVPLRLASTSWHSPQPQAAQSFDVQAHQSAPSGALFASEISVPSQDGSSWELLRSASVHEQVPRGCIGCHGGGALSAAAIDHSFRVEQRVCAACHADEALQAGRVAADQLRARALALARALAQFCQADGASSPHPQLASTGCSNSSVERARYETNLVLDDNAALFHNAELSRRLLSDAERILSAL